MTQKTDKIEAGLERERASLASTLNQLSDRTSIESLASEALGLLRDNAATYTTSIDRAVRANPMAVALTGVGLAWLIFGGSKKPDPLPSERAVSRWEDEGGNPAPLYSTSTEDDDWWDKADDERRHASGLMDWVETQARSLRESASDSIENVRDFAAERAKVVGDFAERLQTALSHGLDDLSAEARDRIVGVRQQAYGVSLQSDATMRKQTGRILEDHPLVMGAITLALGAALASTLPRSRFEDETFGRESDALLEEARHMLQAERAKVTSLASKVMEDVRDVANTGIETLTDDTKRVASEAGAAVKSNFASSPADDGKQTQTASDAVTRSASELASPDRATPSNPKNRN